MKYLLTVLTIFVILSCDESTDNPNSKFPDCVGISGSLDPYHIVNPYSVKITGDTAFYTQFIFTDYQKYGFFFVIPLPTKGYWNMYLKFTNGTTTKYQECWCYYSTDINNFYAWTGGNDNNERYITWDFYFETFDCSKLSGSCLAIRPETNDTLRCRFDGTR